MRAGDLLRRLDSRLLPLLAGGVARLSRGPSRSRVLVGSASASAAAVLLAAVWATGREPVPDYTVGDVVRVGVVEGQSIPGYVNSSRGELNALLAEPVPAPAPPEAYALVTLDAYLPPARLAPVLAGTAVAEVISRVPLPDRQTQIVRLPAVRLPDDVVAGMAQVAARKDGEAQDYRSRSGALHGDGDSERELRRIYDTGAEIAAAEAAAYRSECPCVYAAVVRGTPAALAEIARRPHVRAVDPAPEVRRLERAVFLPPLPEQADVARPPDGDRPATGVAPTGGTGQPASASPVATVGAAPSTTAAPDAGLPSTSGESASTMVAATDGPSSDAAADQPGTGGEPAASPSPSAVSGAAADTTAATGT